MERQQPPSHNPPHEAFNQDKKPGFLERWRKLKKRPKTEVPRAEAQSESGEKQEKPTSKQNLGRRVLNLLGGRGERPPKAEADSPKPAETTSKPESTEQEPKIARTARRMGRRVLAFVGGLVASEEARAPRASKEVPLAEPLRDAAEDLREALDDLQEATEDHNTTPTSPEESEPKPEASGGGGDWTPPERRTAESFAEPTPPEVSERIARLTEALAAERRVAASHASTAAGFGVIAVLATVFGLHQRGKRKRETKAFRKELKLQEAVMSAQSAELAKLQQTQKEAAEQTERREYYQKVSEFTHHQAEVTREVAQVVRTSGEVVAEPAAERPLIRPRRELAEPQMGEKHAPEVVREKQKSPELQPLSRVETADKIEQGPATKSTLQAAREKAASLLGNASDPRRPGDAVSGTPLTPSELAKVRAAKTVAEAKLKRRAWVYSVAFAVAAAITLITFFVL